MLYPNGRWPLSALHAVADFAPLESQHASIAYGSNLMEKQSALQLSGMQRAFYKKFKRRLLVSEGYRPIPVQDYYYKRFVNKEEGWTLAAFPGTSRHGNGVSADLSVEGVGNPSGEYLQWLRDNAWRWGFVNDVVSETWHWSRIGIIHELVTEFIPMPSAAAVEIVQNIPKEKIMQFKHINDSKSKGTRQALVGEPGSGLAFVFKSQQQREEFFNALELVWGIEEVPKVSLFRGSYLAAIKLARTSA